MITFAKPEMLLALKAIWKECFGDTDEYIDFYYANRFRCENTLVWLDNGTPVAMLTLLPAKLKQGGVFVDVQYIYAVATLTAWQGKGISSKLLEYANQLIKNRGEALSLLVPAEAELFAFYKKRGYASSFFLKTSCFSVNLSENNNTHFAFTDISPSEYKQMRDKVFDREGYLCWDETSIAYALDENKFNGGFACKIQSEYGQAAALCYKAGQMLFVREITLQDNTLHSALMQLAQCHGCNSITVRLPSDSTLEGEVHPFGMTSMAQPANGYLNLVLD